LDPTAGKNFKMTGATISVSQKYKAQNCAAQNCAAQNGELSGMYRSLMLWTELVSKEDQ